jgi:hypothetical protein
MLQAFDTMTNGAIVRWPASDLTSLDSNREPFAIRSDEFVPEVLFEQV